MAWALRVLFVASYVLAIGMAGLWLILPWYLPVIYCGILLLAAAFSLARLRRLPRWPVGRRSLLGASLPGILATGFGGLAVSVLMARRPPSESVEVAFPLRGGTYLVVNGGGSSLVNPHLKTLEGERFRPWRGQSYGVDIEKLNRVGLRADGMLPRELGAYAIFGEPVYAPCAGAVVMALDGVRVRPGDRLEVGQLIGRVGNSGNTGEPHLHIHAQRAGTMEAPLSGEPLPIRFGARYPVRNQRIEAADRMGSPATEERW